jgi:predicted  nucleic acid-binding Zn-ribbon protein
LTSPYVRPEQQAVADLERALGHLTDELSAWRRRCQKAEVELQALKTPGGMVPGDDVTRVRGRMLDLERENLDLRARVDRAREMVQRLQQRLDFLEEPRPVESGR